MVYGYMVVGLSPGGSHDDGYHHRTRPIPDLEDSVHSQAMSYRAKFEQRWHNLYLWRRRYELSEDIGGGLEANAAERLGV